MSAVYANNRDLIDDDADRYFFVRDGVELPVAGGPDAGHPPVHPEHEERGRRDVPVPGAVLLEPADVPDADERVWLKGFGCVRRVDDGVEYVGDDIAAVREEGVPVVHWAPASGGCDVRLRTMDADVSGVAEPDFETAAVDDVVQFERVGFARVDGDDDGTRVAYFTHQ
jgi:glutamyl-tRNA synthetase